MGSQPAPSLPTFHCKLLCDSRRGGEEIYPRWSSVGSLSGLGSILTLRSTMVTIQITIRKGLAVFFSIGSNLYCLIKWPNHTWESLELLAGVVGGQKCKAKSIGEH